MPTVSEILTDIDDTLPNSFTQTQKIRWMNDVQKQVWRYMVEPSIYEFNSVAEQALYTMSSDMSFDSIDKVMVSNSTVIDGSETYSKYDYAGMNDQLTGNRYYDGIGNIGLYPVPSVSGYNIKVYYEPRPVTLSTNSLNTTPQINEEYHDIFKWRVKKIIAGSGNAPDVDLYNNFDGEEKEILSKIRMDHYKRKTKNPKDTYPMSEHWWRG